MKTNFYFENDDGVPTTRAVHRIDDGGRIRELRPADWGSQQVGQGRSIPTRFQIWFRISSRRSRNDANGKEGSGGWASRPASPIKQHSHRPLNPERTRGPRSHLRRLQAQGPGSEPSSNLFVERVLSTTTATPGPNFAARPQQFRRCRPAVVLYRRSRDRQVRPYGLRPI